MSIDIYYTYYSYEEFGRGYIGYRKCPKKFTPENDPYLGSYTDRTFKPNHKIILTVHNNAEEARLAEMKIQEYFQVLENPHFVNRSIQTGKGFYIKAHSEETKRKIRISHTGKKASKEARAKMSAAKMGKKLSQEVCEKRRGKRLGESTKEKIRISNLGRPKSKEHRRNISLSKVGKNNPMYGKNKLYSFENKIKGIKEFNISIKEMCSKYQLKSCGLYQLKTGKVTMYRDWTMLISSQSVEG